MNINEAKHLLLIYRPGTTDAEDPQIAEALALVAANPELARWLEAQKAQEAVLRAKFSQIAAPAGLKEQIISEQAAGKRKLAMPKTGWFALAALFLLIAGLAIVWLPQSQPDDTLAVYQGGMARIALGGYSMDVITNNPAPVRAYLAQSHAPADFTMPTGLQQATLMGCAVREWEGAKVSLICFRTDKARSPSDQPDLWLFVVDRTAVKDSSVVAGMEFTKVNRLMTATWTDGDKVFFLGLDGQEADLKKYL